MEWENSQKKLKNTIRFHHKTSYCTIGKIFAEKNQKLQATRTVCYSTCSFQFHILSSPLSPSHRLIDLNNLKVFHSSSFSCSKPCLKINPQNTAPRSTEWYFQTTRIFPFWKYTFTYTMLRKDSVLNVYSYNVTWLYLFWKHAIWKDLGQSCMKNDRIS